MGLVNQVAMYLHVFPDLDVRLEVGGADEPGGDVLTGLARS